MSCYGMIYVEIVNDTSKVEMIWQIFIGSVPFL